MTRCSPSLADAPGLIRDFSEDLKKFAITLSVVDPRIRSPEKPAATAMQPMRNGEGFCVTKYRVVGPTDRTKGSFVIMLEMMAPPAPSRLKSRMLPSLMSLK